MSRSSKPRKVAWYKRYPGAACIRFDIRKGEMIASGTLAITEEKAQAIIDILFPKAKP